MSDDNSIVLDDGQQTEANKAIWEEIGCCQGEIDAYNELIEDYNIKISELTELGTTLRRIRSGFDNRQQCRRAAVAAIKQMVHGTNMAAVFARGMQALLTGSEYCAVCSSMDEAVGAVESKAEEFYAKVQSLSREINYCEDLISDLYDDLQ